MAVTKIKPIKSTLSKALDYIQNPDKTDEKILVSSFGCSYETADIEFEFTIAQALDKGNNLAHHLIQSFAPGEVDYEKAHEIGRQLADAVTKGQHEYVLTTHIDKGHIHNPRTRHINGRMPFDTLTTFRLVHSEVVSAVGRTFSP